MSKIYILIKHFNNIENDYVSILKVSNNLEKLLDVLNDELMNISSDYHLIENLKIYKRLTNIYKEHLLEYIIEEKSIS